MARVELTSEVEKAITMNCPLTDSEGGAHCFEHCALAGACLEYWTGDDSHNQDEKSA